MSLMFEVAEGGFLDIDVKVRFRTNSGILVIHMSRIATVNYIKEIIMCVDNLLQI